MKNVRFIGNLNLEDGFVDITDPSYYRHAWGRRNQLGVNPGKYSCYIVQEDYERETCDGESYKLFRNSAGFIIHESIKDDPSKFREWIDYYIDRISVDTAIVGFFSNKPDFDEEQWNYICDCRFDHIAGHDQFLFTNDQDGFDGFICDTGDGDGIFNLYAFFNDDYEISALKITFADDEEPRANR